MTNRLFARWNKPVRKCRVLAQCFAGCAGLAVLTFYGIAFKVYLPTMSFLYLLLVVMVAALFGFWPASIT